MSYLSEWREMIYERDPVAWISKHVTRSELNQPFALFPFQETILRLAFDFDNDGVLPWDTILWSCPKKSGKTSLLAILSLYWALTQEAPNETVLISNDMEQTLSRAYASVVRLLKYNPSIDPGAIITQKEIKLSNETTIRAIANEYAGAAGSNHGWVGFDELWAYQSERAQRCYEELTSIPTRRNSIKLIVTYAGFEAESHLLRGLYLQGVDKDEHPDGQGERIHDTLPVYANREARLFCYWEHSPRLPWQTPAYYASQRRTLRPSAYLRFHQNQWSTSSETFITPELWDGCVDPTHHPMLPTRSVPIAVGVDASLKRDSSAVVAVGFAQVDGRDVIALARHMIWQPSASDPLDIELTIEAYLRDLCAQYHVASILVDPWQLADMTSRLQKAKMRIELFPQTTGNLTRMGQALLDVLRGKNLLLYPAADMRAQALQTVATESSRGWKISKERAANKIDSIVALGMALVAALDLQAHPLHRFAPLGE
jgi:phage terminase large subunit-like protein